MKLCFKACLMTVVFEEFCDSRKKKLHSTTKMNHAELLKFTLSGKIKYIYNSKEIVYSYFHNIKQ